MLKTTKIIPKMENTNLNLSPDAGAPDATVPEAENAKVAMMPDSINLNLPVDFSNIPDWPESDVEQYFNEHIKGRNVSDLNEDELAIAARHGKIAGSRRNVAENVGAEAEIETVRRNVQVQVDRQALATFIAWGLDKDILDVKNKRQGDIPVEIEFRFGGRSVKLTASEVAAAFGVTSPKLSQFRSHFTGLLEVLKQTAMERRRKIEHPAGRNYSPFTDDIRASMHVNQWKSEVEKGQ